MNLKDPRPPADLLERARSIIRTMRSDNIAVLPDGTTVEELEELLRQALETANEVGIANDTVKKKIEARDKIHNSIWKVTKGGVAFIESRFGDDAVQLEQVGRKRRSKYNRSGQKASEPPATTENDPPNIS